MKNKFKIVAFFLAIICVATIAYGCGRNNIKSEITDSNPITTITASAAQVSKVNFDFEKLCYVGVGFEVYRETTTDTVWVYKTNHGGLSQMFDPQTGLPLTYNLWKEKYAK